MTVLPWYPQSKSLVKREVGRSDWGKMKGWLECVRDSSPNLPAQVFMTEEGRTDERAKVSGTTPSNFHILDLASRRSSALHIWDDGEFACVRKSSRATICKDVQTSSSCHLSSEHDYYPWEENCFKTPCLSSVAYLNYTLSGWITPIDGAQLSCSCPSGQSDKQAVCCVLSLHLVLLRV